MWALLLCVGASAVTAATTTITQPPVFRPNISESIPDMSALFDRGKATEQDEEEMETLSSSRNDDLVHLNESLLLALFNDMVEKEPVVSPEDLRQLLLLQDAEEDPVESSDLFMQMSSETFHRNATPPGFSDQFGSFSDAEASIFAGQSEGLFDDISELDSQSEGVFNNISELDSQSDSLFDSSELSSSLSENLSDNTYNLNYEPESLMDHNIEFYNHSLSTINRTIQADDSLVAMKPDDHALVDLIRQLFVEEKGVNISEIFPSPNLEDQEAGDQLLKASPESSLVQVIQSLLEDENRRAVETGQDQVNRTANVNGDETVVDRGKISEPLEDDQRRGNGSSLTESVLETLQRLFRAGAGRAAPYTQEQDRSNSTTTLETKSTTTVETNSTTNKSMLARILDRIMISPESRLLIELPSDESVDSSAVNFGDEANEDVYLDGLDATRISFDSGETESGTSGNSLVPLTSRQREKVGYEVFYVKAEIYLKNTS
jgi:hypothetical protein